MRADPEALPYQSPQWIEAACAATGSANVSRTYTSPDGKEHVLPLLLKRRFLKAFSSASSMPSAWGMGGLIGNAPATTELVRAVFDDLRQLGLQSISIRPNPRQAEIWAEARPASFAAKCRRAHVLDLRQGFEHVWLHEFDGRTRNHVRKAERRGVTTEFDTSGKLLPIFYALFDKSLERWAEAQNEPVWLARWRGHRRDPLEKLQTIARHMGKMCRIGVAYLEGEPAAAMMVLEAGNANYSRAVMDQALVRNLGINELLQSQAIQHAAETGCNFYHMGESGNSETLSRFKEKFGAKPVKYAEYRFERLPVSRIDQMARTAVKRLIGFRDLG